MTATSAEISNAQQRRFAPTSVNSGGVWSLWEMIKLPVPEYLALIQLSERMVAHCGRIARHDPPVEQQEARDFLAELAALLKERTAELSLSPAMHSMLTSLEKRVASDSFLVLSALTRDIGNALIAELQGYLFLCLNTLEGKRLRDAEASFGDEALDAFQDAHRDMAAAMRCAALNEWTACVFHLMRVLEHGLRQIGDSGEAERSFRREAERHSGMIPNTIGA
jgi:hypothetical protein